MKSSLFIFVLLTQATACMGQLGGFPTWFRGSQDPQDLLWPKSIRGMVLWRKTTDSTGKTIWVQTPITHRIIVMPKPYDAIVPPAEDPVCPPAGCTLLPAGTTISRAFTLFALATDGSLLQLDTQPEASPVVVRSLETRQSLRSGVASPGNELLYLTAISTQSSSTLAPSVQIVNLTTFQPAGSVTLPGNSIPREVVLTPDGKYLYVAAELAAQTFTDPSATLCHIIDTATRTLVKTLRVDGNSPRPEMLMSRDGERIYFTAPGGVAVVDTLTQSISHIIPESGEHIALNPSGTTLYVARVFLGGKSGISVVDLATSTRTRHVPAEDLGTMAMAVTGDGAFLVIDHIVRDASGRNDFPTVDWYRLPGMALEVSRPWSDARDVPLTVGRVLPILGQ